MLAELNKNIGSVLIGVVGYHNLRNHSIGPMLLPRLKNQPWPEFVEIREMNWGPIAIVQRFQEQQQAYGRIVFLTANARPERETGEITAYRWNGKLPSEEQIQRRVEEAVTGVISLENLLIIGEHFNIWPGEVFIVDVEPGKEESGPNLTAEVETKIPSVIEAIRHLSLNTDPNIATLNYSFINS